MQTGDAQIYMTLLKSRAIHGSRPGMPLASGFTLIEIMVVVAIIGVMVAMLGMSMTRDTDRLARLEAMRFHAIVNEVRDEAVLSGEAFLLSVEESAASYFFSGIVANRDTSRDDGLLRRRQVEGGVGVRWEVLDNLDDNDEKVAMALISPLGEITPFEMSFIGDQNTYLVFIDEQNQLAERIEKTNLF